MDDRSSSSGRRDARRRIRHSLFVALASVVCAYCGRPSQRSVDGGASQISAGVCFHDEPAFGGDSFCIDLSEFTTDIVNFEQLDSAGATLSGRVASVRVVGGVSVSLFPAAFGQGSPLAITESVEDLPPALSGVRSFEVRDVDECAAVESPCDPSDACTNRIGGFSCSAARACFYENADKTGASYCFAGASGPTNLPAHLAAAVSFVDVEGPIAVSLFLGAGGGGDVRVVSSDTDLGTLAAFDDSVVSFAVRVSGVDALAPRVSCFPAVPRPPPTSQRVALARAYAVDWVAPTGGAFSPTIPARLYVAEKIGTVSFADPASVAKTVALDLRAHAYIGLDAGLLNIAFSPAFSTDGAIYVVYNRRCTDAAPGDAHNPACPGVDGYVSRIARFRSANSGATFDPATEEVVLDSWNPQDNHTFGAIVFGPDGMLYVGTGDGGNGCVACQANGQDTTSLRGKILRLDVTTAPTASGAVKPGCVVDATRSYCIPSDNPFAASVVGEAGEIWAYGMRNPWKISFDATGRLWAGDVGQDRYEEIDLIERGQNYGWSDVEGPACFHGTAAECADPLLHPPVAYYDHATGGDSVTAGHLYRGSIASLRGAFVFADFVTHRVWALWEDGSHGQPTDPDVTTASGHAVEQLFTTDELIESESLFIPSFLEDAAGELYVVIAGNEFGFNESAGEIYRFIAPGEVDLGSFPTTLSATGCFEQNPWTGGYTMPTDELLPYEVNAPFWSDGASKRRFIVPATGADGQRVLASVDALAGDIDLPVGTVMVKEFRLAGRRVETRLMIRHDGGAWGGYTYRWRADQRDADLLRTDADEVRGDLTWHYPSGAECLQCHGRAAGRTLGTELGQLMRTTANWAGRPANELDTWAYLGVIPWRDTATTELARFRLDEGSGAVAHDALGHFPDVPIVGATNWATTTVSGAVVRTLAFGGTTEVPTGVPSGPTRTLAAWILPLASADVAQIESVIDSDVAGQFGTAWGLDDGKIKVLLDDEFWDTGIAVTMGEWQHVAVRIGAGSATLFVDGASVATHVYVQGDVGDATYSIGLSRANGLAFQGRIYDVRIFSEALDAVDIARVRAGDFLAAEETARLPDPYSAAGPASLDTRARALLHVNCATCHVPGGNGQGGLDLRFDTPLAATGICNTTPQYGTAGIDASLAPRLVVAGEPDRSVLLARMASADAAWRMPAISSHVVDAAAVALVSAYIDALTSCP